jgi:DNA polymerase I-like protein with 3'-5' exonuclease and polymerase domains
MPKGTVIVRRNGRVCNSFNCQNLPSKQESEFKQVFTKDGITNPRYHPIKSVFMASPGHVFMEADWASAELFTIAALAKDDEMLHILNTSDLHTATLHKMFGAKEFDGRPISSYSVEELNKLRKDSTELKKLRIISKAITFGLLYGRGGTAISREVKKEGIILSPAEATEAIQAFFQARPKIAEFIQECKSRVVEPRYLVSPWGRHRRFPYTSDPMLLSGYEREAANFMVQGTVADAMSQALINLWNYRAFVDPTVQYRILLSVHDAVLLEVPVAHIEAVAKQVFPICMCDALEVPKLGLHYSLGEIDVQLRWGEHADPDELLAMGVPREYCGFKK